LQKAPFTEGDILPSGVKIKKPASINLIPSDEDSSDDDDSPQVKNYSSQVDDDHYEETLNSVLSGPKNWILPSGENVSDIVARKLSANAKATKKKKRIFTSEKATLR
jgi:hypothetical protein